MHLQLNEEQDIWQYTWGNNFSSSKAYKILIGHSQHHPSVQWIWNCSCQPKHKVFFWLLLKDRLSTRKILKRKNMFLQSYSCVLCASNTEETVHHLFLQCEFAKQCWEFLEVDILADSEFPNSMAFLKDAIHSQFFMEAAILLCWAIWTTRNAFIFNNVQPELGDTRRVCDKEVKLLIHRVRARSSQAFDQWLHQIT
jgi:hypothetical protein